MRDIVRDAAIITVAKESMTDRAWRSVETFLQTYASNDKTRQELLATLSLFDLVYEKFERNPWEEGGKYVWCWNTDD